ncbi:hypothetical protein IEQ34_010065 [Dendrobium chrysotoxum]|uniref:Uncharacterized protein n=1 Tax=Dendrobium chrysotoxum TaxID=161865 RepID=A0AAV7H2N8_DENCH|nr:hypothetical protein IEQ34_010065 [Dendrobium chrysotoxum]
MFEDVRSVIFCVALSVYDLYGAHAPGSNKPLMSRMLQSMDCLRLQSGNHAFETPFVLVLNKYDIFEEKISKSPLVFCECFSGFSLRTNHNNQSLAQLACYYMAMKLTDFYFHHQLQALCLSCESARSANC